MAKITGTSEFGFLVDMTPTEAKRVFATKTPIVGTDKNINVIYNQLIYITKREIHALPVSQANAKIDLRMLEESELINNLIAEQSK